MKYLSEEDEQHVAEDFQGPPGASLRFHEARGSANWHDHQRLVALQCFRIVQGPGDAGSEAEFNCRRVTEQSGWMRLAARIIDSQNEKGQR